MIEKPHEESPVVGLWKLGACDENEIVWTGSTSMWAPSSAACGPLAWAWQVKWLLPTVVENMHGCVRLPAKWVRVRENFAQWEQQVKTDAAAAIKSKAASKTPCDDQCGERQDQFHQHRCAGSRELVRTKFQRSPVGLRLQCHVPKWCATDLGERLKSLRKSNVMTMKPVLKDGASQVVLLCSCRPN